MSIRLPVVNLTGAVVGTTGTVQWASVQRTPTQAQRNAGDNGTLVIRNESGCGLAIQFDASEQTTYFGAGEWARIALALTDTAFAYTVDYTLNNPPVSRLIVVYFQPGEVVTTPGYLGNSPIGLSGVIPTSVTQVIQDGQPNGQTIVEATPTGQPQNVLITTDGIARLVKLLAGINAPANTSVLQVSATNAQGNRIAVFTNATTVATDNADLIDFIRTSTHAQQFTLGINPSGELYLYDATNAVFLWRTNNASGMKIDKGIGAVTGQVTAGNFGVPMIVAQAFRFLVNVTTAIGILDYITTASGLFRVSVYLLLNNGTQPQKVSMQLNWTDPQSSTGFGLTMSNSGGLQMNGTNNFFNAGTPLDSVLIAAVTGTHIILQYTDPLNTPNDEVSVIIERLA